MDSLSAPIGYSAPILFAFTTHSTISQVNWIYTILLLPLVGMHILSTLRDAPYDRKAGMTTSGIILGRTKSLIACAILFLIPLYFFGENIFLTSLLVTSFFFIGVLSFTKKDRYFFSLLMALNFAWILALVYYIFLANC